MKRGVFKLPRIDPLDAHMTGFSLSRSLASRQLASIALFVGLGLLVYLGVSNLSDQINAVLAAEPGFAARGGAGLALEAGQLCLDVLVGTPLAAGLAAAISVPFLHRKISRPIHELTAQMTELAAGNTALEIANEDRADEIGAAARALAALRDAMRAAGRLEDEARTQADRETQKVQDAAIRERVETFAADVAAATVALGSLTRRMSEASEAMVGVARHAGEGSDKAKTASGNAAGDVSSVANASEQLLESIGEISRQVVQATAVVKKAVAESAETNAGMAKLSAAARRVGDVVSLISRIAAQTNLLALNATIEAARAGEAGRGFAVVAQEVKTLATQTARATQDIAEQIADMQAATETSVAAIETIQRKISEVEHISAIIASAVHEQGASTQEIARNVRSAASGTAAMTSYVENVATAVAETGNSVETVVGLARELDRLVATLTDRAQSLAAAVKVA
jgi:methyl-accepting chemotaxis protein